MDGVVEKSVASASSPLFILSRSGVPELAIPGVAYMKVQGRELGADFAEYDPETVIVGRSLMKPWQFLACDVAGEQSFWALGLSSHNAEPEHIKNLEILAKEAGASEDDLFCPRAYPLDWEWGARLKLSQAKPVRMHHPCSGKHLLMVASCNKHGDAVDHYWNTDHPMQRRVSNVIGKHLSEKPYWAQDSCGLPTIAVTARAHMMMWENLLCSDDEDVVRMKTLWTSNPRIVGGRNRLDSDLIELGKGRIVAKEGADGLLLVQSIPVDGEPAAGCLIKLASGYNVGYLALALYSVLSRVESLPKTFQDILDYLRSRLETWVPEDQSLVLPPYN